MALDDIPLLILVAILAWMAFGWFRDRYGKKTCTVCGKGIMQEMEAKPERLMHSSPHQSSGITVVRYKVKYQCTHCKQFEVITESRQ